MKDAKIPVIILGGGHYIVRNGGKPRLGQGAYMAVLESLSRKFGFTPVLKPSKGVMMSVETVSTYFSRSDNHG